jgi:hypothetical protein
MFGPEPEGEELRTVKFVEDYKEKTRVLRRKGVVHDESTLLGKTTVDCLPLAHSDICNINLFKAPEGLYRVAFKSTERTRESAEEIKERNLKINGYSTLNQHELSPLRQRIRDRTFNEKSVNPFSNRSAVSTIGQSSPISTIRSPGKANIAPKGYPLDPLLVASLKSGGHGAESIGTGSGSSSAGQVNDPDDFADLNIKIHDGKYYFDGCIKSLAERSIRLRNSLHKDYSKGALENWSRSSEFRIIDDDGDNGTRVSTLDDDDSSRALSSGRLSCASSSLPHSNANPLQVKGGLKTAGEKLGMSTNSLTKRKDIRGGNKSNFGEYESPKRQPVKPQQEKQLFDQKDPAATTIIVDLPHDLKMIKHALKKIYEEKDIYTPVRPKTTKFLKKNEPTEYAEIEKELLLPVSYDGEVAYGDEADAMYHAFLVEQRERAEQERLAWKEALKIDGENSTVLTEDESIAQDENYDQGDDENLALTALEELKLSGQLVQHQGLKNFLQVMGGGRST